MKLVQTTALLVMLIRKELLIQISANAIHIFLKYLEAVHAVNVFPLAKVAK